MDFFKLWGLEKKGKVKAQHAVLPFFSFSLQKWIVKPMGIFSTKETNLKSIWNDPALAVDNNSS